MEVAELSTEIVNDQLDAGAVGCQCVVPNRASGTTLGDSTILVCKRGRFTSGVILSVCISPGRFIAMPILGVNKI